MASNKPLLHYGLVGALCWVLFCSPFFHKSPVVGKLDWLVQNRNTINPMPRLLTRDIIEAYRLHKLLPLLLKECRSINSAQNELRWLTEAVGDKNSNLRRVWQRLYQKPCQTILSSVCRARSKGMPLQYILGDQPFGDLEILCEKGVLIPRFALFTHIYLDLLTAMANCFCAKDQKQKHIPFLLATYWCRINSLPWRELVNRQSRHVHCAYWISVLGQDASHYYYMPCLLLISSPFLSLVLISVPLRYVWPIWTLSITFSEACYRIGHAKRSNFVKAMCLMVTSGMFQELMKS